MRFKLPKNLLNWSEHGAWMRADPANVSRLLLWTTLALVLLFLVWASLSKVDQVTRAAGTVVPSNRTQVIQTPDGGVLEELLVREGDMVEVDQVVARFAQAQSEPYYLESLARASALRLNIQRLESEANNTPFRPVMEDQFTKRLYQSQRELFDRRQSALQEELSALTQSLALAEEELALVAPLVKLGDVSRSEQLRLERELVDLRAQLVNRRNGFRREIMTELTRAREELASLEQTMAQRKTILDRSELRSPARGLIKGIKATTKGAVLRAGDELMQVVPQDDELIIEARVKPSEVGFVVAGLPASVKIDAFDYTIFGSLKGQVVLVSPDSTVDEKTNERYFLVRVRVTDSALKGPDGSALTLQPGMSSMVEVQTGRHSILSYLFKPLIKTVSTAMRER
jgi:membrane fusion protein, adhesin transport system